jgi:hypothetical protein
MNFILLAGDAQATITWRTVPTRGLKRWLTFRNYAHSEPRFRVLLTDEGSREIHGSILYLILCKDQPRNPARQAS